MSRRELTTAAYITLLGVLAVVVLYKQSLTGGQPDPVLLAFISLSMAVAGLNQIPTAEPNVSFNFGSTFRLFALLVGGLPMAVWASAVSMLAVNLIQKRRARNVALNTSQHVLAALIAGELFQLLGGESGAGFHHPLQAVAAAVTLMAVNVSIMIGLFVIIGHELRETSRKFVRDLWNSHYAMSMLFGILAAFVHVKGGWVWSLGVWIMVILIHRIYHHFYAMYADADRQRSRLFATLNATQSAIVMADSLGCIQVANARYGDLVGISPEGLAGLPLAGVEDKRLRETVGSLRATHPGQQSVEQVVLVPGEPVRYFHWYRGPVEPAREGDSSTIEVLTDVTSEREAQEKLRQMYLSMISALTAAIDARDAYTHGHSDRVSLYAVAIARSLELPEADVDRIRYSALLHDIGKIGIDDKVLQKRGPLTPEERTLMMDHTVIGAKILEQAGVFADVIPGVRWHHEWINGLGYPDGLAGDAIPLDARILCVADSFDAMTSDRPYRRALTPEEALARLHSGQGTQFDPAAVAGLQEAIARGDVVVQIHSVPSAGGPPPKGDDPRANHGRELSIIFQVFREVSAQRGLKAAARRFLEICYDTVGRNTYAVYLRPSPLAPLTLQITLGASHQPVRAEQDWLPVAVRSAEMTGKTVHLPALEPGESGSLFPDARSVLALPLQSNGRTVGVLNIEADTPGAFTEEEIQLLEAIVPHLANAVELARHYEQFAREAAVDRLTGVYTHSVLYQRLEEYLVASQATWRPLAVAILDVRGLSAINDTYGLEAGDQALAAFARQLRDVVGESGLIARYGGDKFALVLPGVTREAVSKVLEELSQAPEELLEFGEHRVPVPRCIAGAAAFPEDGDRPAELMAAAVRAARGEKLRLGA